MALGARRGALLRLVLGRGMSLAGLGALAGTAGALAFARLLSGFLFEVRATEPLVFAGSAALRSSPP